MCTKRTQFPAAGQDPRDRSRQTKPIAPGPAGRAIAGATVQNEPNFRRAEVPHHSNTPLFQHSDPMPIVQNEPNSQEPGGRLCKTNPISAGSTGPGGTERAKRTQFPAGPGGTGPGGTRRVAGCRAKQSQFRAGRTEGKCAKRTQFPAGGISHRSTTLSFHHSNPTGIVRNEPNFPALPGGTGSGGWGSGFFPRPSALRPLASLGQSCKTKPIWLSPQEGRSPGAKSAKRSQFPRKRPEGQVLCRKRVMVNWTGKRLWRNKANFRMGRPVRGPARLPVPPVGSLVQTKPILAGPGRRSTSLRTKEEEVGRGRPTHEEGNRAKPSQFRPERCSGPV
jgi:hypothetical protein